MSNQEFTLENYSLPVFQKSDQKAFLPNSKAQNLRQKIYGFLAALDPDADVTLQELSKALEEPYKAIYTASKMLVRKGFATRHKVKVMKPTKKDSNNFVFHIGLRYVQPFVGKSNKEWYRKR